MAAEDTALAWVLAKLAASKRPAAAPAPVYQPPPPPAAPKVETEAERQARLAKVRSKELNLWHQWKETGKPEDYHALLKSHEKLINQRLGAYRGAEVNRAAMRSILVEGHRAACETYDPTHKKGASLSTHVFNNLRRLQRYVIKHQNVLRINDALAGKIGAYKSYISELTDKLGYEPTPHQVADYSLKRDKKLSLKDVTQLQKQLKRSYDIAGGGAEVEGAGAHYDDPYMQAAHIVYHQLKPAEQKVHSLMFPLGSETPLYSNSDIAKRLNWHVSKVSKARSSILDKIQAFVGD